MERSRALRATDELYIEGGEQGILHDLLKHRHYFGTSYSNLTFSMLPQTKYTSGKWYDGGRGGDGLDQREACKAEGVRLCVAACVCFGIAICQCSVCLNIDQFDVTCPIL